LKVRVKKSSDLYNNVCRPYLCFADIQNFKKVLCRTYFLLIPSLHWQSSCCMCRTNSDFKPSAML